MTGCNEAEAMFVSVVVRILDIEELRPEKLW